MADVYNYIASTGTITTSTSTIQDEVNTEYKNAFGADLIVTPDTPQGVLITTEVLARIAVADNNAALANQINPQIAGGVFLDAIGMLTGIQRTPASNTIVNCDVTGVPGTIIPAGSVAQDSVQLTLFQSVSDVTIAINGTGNVNFSAVSTGAITVAATDLSVIVSGVLGWETVNNPAIQISVGTATQSDAAFRLFRNQTLALQGDSLSQAIISGLLATDNVQGVSYLENISPSTVMISGVTMIGHSIYACVDGGTDADVAGVLNAKKSGGAAYNNGASMTPVTVNVTDPYSGQTIAVLFDRPDLIPILIRVYVHVTSALQDPASLIKQALLDYAAGLIDGEAGITVGTSVSCFELAGAINKEQPSIFVTNLQTTLASSISYSTITLLMDVFQKATYVDSSITVILS